MAEYVRGLVVRARAGHDKGDFLAVLEAGDGWAIIADGKRRPLEKPKRKKQIHLASTDTVLSEEQMETNRKLRNALRPFRERAE